MTRVYSILATSILIGCAVTHAVDIPHSWITTEASIDDIHDYYYSLCLNLSKRQVYVNGEPHSINLDCKRGEGNPFKRELEPGSKIYRYRSPKEYWEQLAGSEGFVLVSNGKIVDVITTTVN
jgi:hypothetical protein